MKMEHTECSETSAYIIQTPGNYPKENIMYSEHGESLKSRLKNNFACKKEKNNVQKTMQNLFLFMYLFSRTGTQYS